MQTETATLATLKPLERNPRRHPAAQIRELKRSIERFGQIRPIVIDEDDNVLAGNGMLAALLELGRETGDVLRVVGLSEADKKRLVLADNKVASLGLDDFAVVEELLRELADDGLDIPGFDDSIIRTVVAMPVEIRQISEQYGQVSGESREAAERAGERIERATSAPAPAPAPAPVGSVEQAEIKTCPECGQRVWP